MLYIAHQQTPRAWWGRHLSERSCIEMASLGRGGSNNKRVYVCGVGMTKFEKPLTKKWDYPDMAREAVGSALADAGLQYQDVQAVVASYCYGDPACGQRAVYEMGMTGVPVFNVNNNCSSGSTALMLARALVQSGYGCVLAVGFEKMERGLSERYPDKASPIQLHFDTLTQLGADPELISPQTNKVTSDTVKMFAYAARTHSEQHGTTPTQYAKIAYKNRYHGTMNPRACFQKEMSVGDIQSKRMVCAPITIGMSAATADGSAAAIVCGEEFMALKGLQNKAVEILSQHMCTDLPTSFGHSFINLCGYEISKVAAQRCFSDARRTIHDVDVLELHDCFAPNELFLYEALGMCPEGCGGKMIDDAKWIRNSKGGRLCQLGGRWVVNASGGLESKGHPIGATGIAQCAEICWQLRGEGGVRQVEGASCALQHNMGLGSAAVVTLYGKFGRAQSAHL